EKLVSETVFVNLPDEKYLRSLAQWNDEKETALQSLTDEIRDDPKVRLRMHKLARQELENIKTELSDHLALLGDEAIIKIKDTYTEMTTKAVMARVAVEGFGKSIPIFDIGSESWRQMLLYARQFAGEAFPERGDPKLVTAESCVLCQQSLDDEAAARMAEFDDYISGCAASDSREARLKYEGLVASTNALKLRTSDQVKTSLSVYAAMDGACQIVAEEIAQAYGVLGSRLDAVKMMIEAEVFWESDSMEAIPNDLVDKIDASLTEFQEQIVVLGNVDKFEERFKVLTSKKAEFEDERKLSQNIETVVARLNQLVKRFKILDARKQCSSGPIAKQLTARRRVLFTNSLETQLRAELTKLELSHISINLLDRSVGANSVIEVDLAANNRFASKSDVLSDGEQRALALSCFLAELIEVGAKHGIIIDDPVSSLDHSRMEAVAKRLVEEAKAGRQVIIFTHNIIFHYMMENEARRSLVPLHSEWMSSLGGTKFGIIGDSGKPPHTKKVKQRINDLSKKTTELFNDNYDCTLKKFRDPLTAIYTEMRETWERIVEEILFNGTIQRFRSEVMTKSLQYACYNPADDYPAIYEGMKRCSLYSGHDKAVDWSQYLPTEEDIKSDLKELIDFYEKVSSRKKKLEDGHNYEKVPKPEFL
ncbi:MAG: AAA family ATPase, partial [Rhodobacteraceae bacterium]|nr:AAA family ATPase [Paracoccaceae bacterium]